MTAHHRRRFLQIAAVAATRAIGDASALFAAAKDIKLGLFVYAGEDPEGAIRPVHDFGFPTCQLAVEHYEPEIAGRLRSALDRYRVEVTAMGVLGPGRVVWDFYEGPLTVGLVPAATRRQRIEHFKRASDFARKFNFPALHTHAGFIPEDPNEPLYQETVAALREVAGHCKANGQTILYETGQESPITLLRTIQDVGLDNQFVNLDTANLILYGKGNPVDALDVIGRYVRGVHAKDGLFPTDPKRLGEEVPIGQGRVDFPRVIRRLRELGYRGAITIEREISGPQQIEDIRKAKAYLEKLLR